MAILYNIIFLIFAIAYLPYLLIKGKAHKDFWQRFGILSDEFKKIGVRHPVWVHTVSVGEVLAARQFVNLLNRECKRPMVISTTTKTGHELAKSTFSKDILKFYFPLDLTFVVKKTLGIIKPRIFIVFETEIWPNLIMELCKRKIPVVLLNGRVSDSSYGGYRTIRFLFKRILNLVDTFCMQTALDRERIIDIGAHPGKVKVTGNMKFDTLTDSNLSGHAILDKLSIKQDEKLLVAGSTHTGEDEIVLDVYKQLLKDNPCLRLLIAPRHIERSRQIAGLVEERGFGFRMISDSNKPDKPGEITVLILDTIGELKEVFKLATMVFMGGSLVRKGGHNIIEPALYARPVIFGPHMSNFRDMARIFVENGAAIQIKDKNSLRGAFLDLLKDEDKRRKLGRNAQQLVEKHKGATKRNLDEVLGRIG